MVGAGQLEMEAAVAGGCCHLAHHPCVNLVVQGIYPCPVRLHRFRKQKEKTEKLSLLDGQIQEDFQLSGLTDPVML